MCLLYAFGLVPFAFIHRDTLARMAGHASVGEEIRRVGEDEVHGILRDGGEDFEAVALKDFDVVARVVEYGRGQRRVGGREVGGFGHVSGDKGRSKQRPYNVVRKRSDR